LQNPKQNTATAKNQPVIAKPALLKRFVLIYLPTVMLISIALWLLARFEEQAEVKKIELSDRGHIEIAQAHILQKFKEIDADLRTAANLPVLQDYLDTSNPALLQDLAQYFLVLSKEKPHFDNVRYLNSHGLEVVRINSNDGTPVAVPQAMLQDKSRRYFFNDIFNLNNGEVYVSPFDLLVEENQLVIPFKPTIRFGTPIHDDAGRKKGVILLNYLANDLLVNFQKIVRGEGRNAMLLNSDGYWLSNSANPADEWGFMLDKSDRRFEHDFPEEWGRISKADEGTLLTANGLFIYSTVYPLVLGQHTSSGSNTVFGASQQTMKSSEYFWKIVLFTPRPTLSGHLFYYQNNYRLAIFVVYLLSALGAFNFASLTLSRKQMRDELGRIRHDTEKAIMNSFSSAIVTIDQAGVITSFNEGAKQIFGYNDGEILGKNVRCLMPPAVAEQHDDYLQRYLDAKDATHLANRREVEGRRKNGEVFPAVITVTEIDVNGELQFFGVIDDITESKSLQAQLAQAQKLEAIGQLAAGVAHEINTPIQYIGDNLLAVQGYMSEIVAYQQALSALADQNLKLQLDELAKQYDLPFILEDSPKALQQAYEGVGRVTQIVKAMKSFSHVDASHGKQTIDLHDALNNTLIISRNNTKYIAEIETDYDPDVGFIECYPSELNQVFLNLIINAAHAIEEKQAGMGKIRIVTRKLDDVVEILISDNGAGIPEQIREKVFNLFFTTKKVGKGTGQGLSLSHNIIVEKHQGKLFFESSPGIGTIFHIQLPINLKN
jgi:PAS domain S-box-containing protein